MDLLFHNKLLLEHPPKLLTSRPEKSLPRCRGDMLQCPGTCTEIIQLLFGLDQKKTLEAGSLSHGVICSRIDDISFNILKQVAGETAASLSSLWACWCYQRILTFRVAFANYKGCGHFESSKKCLCQIKLCLGRKASFSIQLDLLQI